MNSLLTRVLFLGFAAALALAAAGCGGGDDGGAEVPNWRFAGRVEGTDAFIGFSTGGESAIVAYVCDGKEISQWFKGFVEGDSAVVEANGGQLTVEFDGDGATGTVRLADGSSHSFTAERVSGDHGLWRADSPVETQDVVGGWIVLASGEQRGSIAFITGTETVLNAAPLLNTSSPFISVKFEGAGGVGLSDTTFALRASKVGSMSSIDWP